MRQRFDLPPNKIGIDLSFAAAWRDWMYRERFPQISTDLRNGSDPIWVISRASDRTHTLNLFWERHGAVLCIYARARWDEGEIDYDEAAQTIDGDVPAEGWEALAIHFLSHLGH